MRCKVCPGAINVFYVLVYEKLFHLSNPSAADSRSIQSQKQFKINNETNVSAGINRNNKSFHKKVLFYSIELQNNLFHSRNWINPENPSVPHQNPLGSTSKSTQFNTPLCSTPETPQFHTKMPRFNTPLSSTPEVKHDGVYGV